MKKERSNTISNMNRAALPVNLQIETTNYCNARCIMCSHCFSNNHNSKNIGADVLNNMTDALLMSETISLNGVGEPFITPGISELIDFYVSYNNKIIATTNLSVLNDTLVAQIRNHFVLLQISCDGATKETYESIRIGLSFDTFLKNLSLLKDKAPNVEKCFSTVIMRQNVQEMADIVYLAYKNNVKSVYFMPLIPNKAIGNEADSLSYYPLVLDYFSMKAVKRGEELNVKVSVPNKNGLNRLLSYDDIRESLNEMQRADAEHKKVPEENEMRKRALSIMKHHGGFEDAIEKALAPSDKRCKGVCEWAVKRSYIDVEGNVSMCCRNPSIIMGNIKIDGCFSHVWNSVRFRHFREVFDSGFFPNACLGCGYIKNGLSECVSIEEP